MNTNDVRMEEGTIIKKTGLFVVPGGGFLRKEPYEIIVLKTNDDKVIELIDYSNNYYWSSNNLVELGHNHDWGCDKFRILLYGEDNQIVDVFINFFSLEKVLQGFDEELNSLFPSRKGENQEVDKTYLMVDRGSGQYKIGRSKDIHRRYNAIKSMCPMIEFIGSCDINIETQLHREFEAKRQIGEWFNLTEKDVAYVLDLFKKKY